MTTFLDSIAQAYTKHYNDLSDFCFIFPSKRSGNFFKKSLKEAIKSNVAISPKIITINEFITELSDRNINNRIDLLFILYKEYVKLVGEDVDFDKFRTWGDTILNDFNEVDMSCVDADALFKNIKDYKEIQSNYLTKRQRDVINDYFGNNDPISSTKTFWNHFNTESKSESKSRFLKLWETLSPLYHNFNKELEHQSTTYSGGAYRLALQNLCKSGTGIIRYKRVIMVGFNVLSAMEYHIFSELKNLKDKLGNNIADFYWDCTGPALNDKNNSATKFIDKNKKLFPSQFDISSSDTDLFPSNIEIISCPSNTSQAKKTGDILHQIINSKYNNNPNDEINIAIVMPDEELLIPLLHSFPDNVSTANLTMGYPIKLTSTSSFISLIRKAYDRSSSSKGETLFYYEDVKSVFSHPYTHILIGTRCIENCKNIIFKQHLFNISANQLSDFSNGETNVIFQNISKNASAQETIKYLDNLLDLIQSKLIENSNSDLIRSNIEIDCIEAYIEALNRLYDSITNHNIKMSRNSLLLLSDRLLASEKVSFEGEPLEGIQIMGILESRCLDFDYIIIPSMNERIFPRRMRSRSFIPNTLRMGYGMPTSQFQESIFAYYFYRMISRAKEVYMLYDARTSGFKSSDQSRYISQLKYLYDNANVRSKNINFAVSQFFYEPIIIEKTDKILNSLNQYLNPTSGKYLSASSLKNYLSCPLMFYLKNIEGINSEIEPSEFMDAITIGNIFHNVMQDIYTPKGNSNNTLSTGIELEKGKLITYDFIDKILNNQNLLKLKIDHEINIQYNGIDNKSEIHGNALIFRDIILEYVIVTLKADKELTPFIYKGSEVNRSFQWTINDNLKVNIKYIIDRLDIVKINNFETLRIVDYKTGTDDTKIKSIDDIFNKGGYKAIFQLLLYANLYAIEHNCPNRPIKPSIYKTQDLAKGTNSTDIILDKDPIQNYITDTDNELFLSNVKSVIEEIFSDQPFKQTENINNCKFCDFKAICGRKV